MKFKKFNRAFILVLLVNLFTLVNLKIINAFKVENNSGELFEVSDSVYLSPIDELMQNKGNIKNINPIYGNYYKDNLEVIIGNNDLLKVKDVLVYPFSTSCYLDINSGSARGSANFIGDNVLLTAAHNVYDNNSKSFNEVYVIPAAGIDTQPFGKIKVNKIYILDDYKSENENIRRQSDLAVLIIDVPIGAKLGSLGLYKDEKNLFNKNVTITGYPSFEFSEKQMYTDSKKIVKDTGIFFDYEIDTLGGSSGSCVYDDNFYVVGIHVLGNIKDSKNSAIKLNNKNLKFINSILNNDYLSGWKKVNNNWFYYLDGKKVLGWKNIDNKWYYFENSGEMKIGWNKVDGKWYYLASSGEMKTGWEKVDGKWYYLADSGEMKIGWQEINKKWYYFKNSGEMVTGRYSINGKIYIFNSDGELLN